MDAALLDTDMLNEVLKHRNPYVVQHGTAYLRQHSQFAISAITRYELLRGLKERGATAQLARFELFCQRTHIEPVSGAILDRATDLWVLARQGGFPARDADLIIAATSLELNRGLVTGNTAHFSWIPSLSLENWRQPISG
jgi:predicted nucleic acid-binding protein